MTAVQTTQTSKRKAGALLQTEAGAAPVSCSHCGAACSDRSISIQDETFCCHGCRIVYEVLGKSGLDHFYDLESRPGIRIGLRKDATDFAYLDDESIRDQILDFTDGKTARATFHIPAIHCIACVWLLENLFRLDPRIGRTQVNFPRRELTVWFPEQDLSLSELVGLIASLGYEPSLNLASLDQPPIDAGHRTEILRLGVAGFCFGNIMLLSVSQYLGLDSASQTGYAPLFGALSLILALPVVFFSAAEYWNAAWTGLRRRIITIDVPIALGIAALFAQSLFDILTRAGEGYLDSLSGLVFFLLIGKWFQRKTYDRLSFDRDYRSYFPLSVTRVTRDVEEVVPVTRVCVGDRIVIRNQELIPADAILIRGNAHIDYSFVTGEVDPSVQTAGDRLHAGGRQVGGAIEVELVKPVSQSYLTSLWNNEAFSKDRTTTITTLANRVSKHFTLAVIAIASASALYWAWHDPTRAVRAFSSTLIVACPCALALSAPFALGAALRIFGRRGLYLRNADVVEGLARVSHVVFDKTGTLTHSATGSVRFDGTTLLEEEKDGISALTRQSTHPMSVRISSSLGDREHPDVEDFHEVPGGGIEGTVRGRRYALGSTPWFYTQGIADADPDHAADSGVCVAIDGCLRGRFSLRQEFRADVQGMVRRLGRHRDLAVLTGDHEGRRAGLTEVFGESIPLHFRQQPEDKLSYVRDIQAAGARVMMVGDGLNDAGALRQSDVGVAVCEDVTAFSPACDAILDADEVPHLARFVDFARSTVAVVMVSFFLSVVYNVVGLSFAARGALSPLVSAILMPLSSVTVVAFALAAVRWNARRKDIL